MRQEGFPFFHQGATSSYLPKLYFYLILFLKDYHLPLQSKQGKLFTYQCSLDLWYFIEGDLSSCQFTHF